MEEKLRLNLIAL